MGTGRLNHQIHQIRIYLLPLFVLVALCAVPQTGNAGDLAQSRKELKQIEERILKTQKDLKGTREKQQAIEDDLEKVSREHDRIQKRLKQVDNRINSLGRDISQQEKKLKEIQRGLDSQQKEVNKRLVAMYKGGEAGLLRILFSPSPPSEMMQEYDFLSRIVEQDQVLLSNYRLQLESRRQALTRLDTLRDDLQKQQAALEDDRKNLKKAQKLKNTLLAKVKGQRSAISSRLKDLKEKATRLTGLIKKLESAKPREYTQESTPFSRMKGKLPWPVKGSVVIGFGSGTHPELGTQYDSHGLELEVSGNRPIGAIWPGEIAFANWFKGYGNLMIIDHGDNYYSLYAHTSRLQHKVGDRISQGETIAFTGEKSKERFYFEIRHRGTPVNPQKWLAPR